MNPYVRPPIDAPIFRDASGAIIDYGRRWEGSPPEDSYSVETHLERFAPLHEVADALIEHLRQTYDVEVDEGVEVASDLLHSKPDIVRAVRIRPGDPSCATLTLVFTATPRSTFTRDCCMTSTTRCADAMHATPPGTARLTTSRSRCSR